MNIWYGMGALYVVIFIHTRYKICLILVVCCVWENIIRVQGKVLQSFVEMQLGEMQHFNNTPLGEMQSGEMQLSQIKYCDNCEPKKVAHWSRFKGKLGTGEALREKGPSRRKKSVYMEQ
ncbi:hypothetical protein H8356DRAFT_1423962 [Neocallimastix lanati (nom. inval.)]|nr:hypothetical protein H8356DRAFT_1423962 [Neocallimastix sp. JGI-2020a]